MLGYMQTLAIPGMTMTVAIATGTDQRGDKDCQHDMFLCKVRSTKKETRYRKLIP